MQVAYIMKKAVFLRIVLTAAVLALLLSGCRFVRVEEEERKPVDYTIVERRDIPEELSRLMEEKKEKEFQLSYETGDDLYLAKGYGRQMSGGYSIQVEELGESSNGIFFVTKLLGPKDLKEAGVPSYPCIVITGKAGNVPGKQQSGEQRVGERGIDCGIKKRKHADIKGKKQGKKSDHF